MECSTDQNRRQQGRTWWGAVPAFICGLGLVGCSDSDKSATTADAQVAEAGSVDAADETNTSEASADAAVGDAGETFGGSVLVATTDFASTEIASVDLRLDMVTGRHTFADGDVVPKTSDGRRFALERTNDRLQILDADGLILHTVELHGDGATTQNPHDVVVIPGTAKAFVPLFNTGKIAVVDVDAGAVTSILDLTSLSATGDPDGSPDIEGGIYVAATGLVYFSLQRIDTTTFPTPCPSAPSLIVGIDPSTLAVVDINGAAAGDALELGFVSPGDMSFDATTGRLFVLSNGCTTPADAGGARIHHGIEAITLATGATQPIYTPTSQDYLSQLLVLQTGLALVQSADASFKTHWNQWDLASPTLGAAITGIPTGAERETADTLLGVQTTPTADGGAGGYDVVRYRVSSGETSVAVANPLAAPFSYTSGLAFVP